ncbi:hypothetical protein EHI42_19715 [Rhizobium hidalgonense]|uniref:hypothetical protein n=1 Tax=Rhizobium hidalgonense TaxID=1538159 RepID=UPI000FEC99F2|nr:hypothetical protein [Rhizobium hidalgonense]RWX13624.1 hypothetical protein EHI42_19715 [Rhizobium hidalgonense]
MNTLLSQIPVQSSSTFSEATSTSHPYIFELAGNVANAERKSWFASADIAIDVVTRLNTIKTPALSI